MRPFFIIVLGFGLFFVAPARATVLSEAQQLSAASVKEQCVPIQTPQARYVDQNSKGYVPVGIVIKVPVAAGVDPASVAQKADFRFWIRGGAEGFRLNKGMYLQSASECTGVEMYRDGEVVSGAMLLLKVRAYVSERYSVAHGYVLAAGLFLPAKLVAQRPPAGTLLASGQQFRGVWQQDSGMTVLALEPIQE